jgi:DNA-dependent RNA polymerase auxiliary subunit epsilon
MTILTPTKDTGATTKPATPMVYVEPALVTTEAQQRELLPDARFNVAFVADVLSAMLTHERCGRHLYRSVEGRTNNPILESKYREFGEETEHHVEILEAIVTEMGGNPAYVSPSARAVEGMDTKLLESTFMFEGSLDVMTAELAMLDAVFLAEAADHANWKTLGALVDLFPEGPVRASLRGAVDEIEKEEDKHLGWASQTKQKLVVLQAKHGALAAVGAKAEELIALVRNWLRD